MTVMLDRPAVAQRAAVPSKRVSRVTVTAARGEFAWLAEAACRLEDPELFYEHTSSIVREKAKAVCRSCPVLDTCLERVMAEESAFGGSPYQNEKYRYGVRGGLTSTERWELAYPEEAAARREREAKKKSARSAA